LEHKDAYQIIKENKYLGNDNQNIDSKIKTFGLNVIEQERFVLLKKILKAIFSPFILILVVLGGYSFYKYFFEGKDEADISDLASGVIVLVMIFLSIVITIFQDVKSWNSTKKLQEMIKVTSAVYRYDPQQRFTINNIIIDEVAKATSEMPISQIVPGDIIHLSSGDLVPADVVLLSSKDLFINESSLTGENLPIEKHAFNYEWNMKEKIPLTNIAFMGSSVVSGSAVGLVLTTGKKTYFGNISNILKKTKITSSFDKGIKKVTFMLLLMMAVIVPSIFIIKSWKGGWTKDQTWQAFAWAIAVAISLTPEMLPMILTSNLARGAIKMSKEKVIVKNLNVMQSFGGMDILCTDKTGTLTEDEIELIKYLDLNGKQCLKTFKYGYLNSKYQTGLKNNIDQTIINYANKNFQEITTNIYGKVDELPFDFVRRRMSVIVKESDDFNTMITKGAIEEMVKISTKVEINNKQVPLTPKFIKKFLDLSNNLNSQGIRVVAIAYKETNIKQKIYKLDDEKDMILLGVFGFIDIPKATVYNTIKSMHKLGVDVKIITGDNEIVTKAICQKVGIDPKIPILGTQLDKMDDEQLQQVILKTNIFAKVSPIQKSRIVITLQNMGKTVGFLGDGINDAVAIKAADIGISVDSATDIAKEASDIIMLEKSLESLTQGIIQGRNTFVNILKYIKITLAGNFGNAISMVIAALWFPEWLMPMIGLQILVQNLLYDFSQIFIPWDNVDKEMILKPRKWEAKSFLSFSVINGLTSSIFDITIFVLLSYFLLNKANGFPNTENDIEILIFSNGFHVGYFLIATTTQLTIFHILRTEKIPFYHSNASWLIYLFTFLTLIFTILVAYIPIINKGLGFGGAIYQINPYFYLSWFLIIVFYFLSQHLIKVWYKQVFKVWI
ncbi:MAG: magnesium-translocating P-type ATPase, partial [Mycoplasma sp.]|nr:magnesium-translocating P-type ATPase [Mycoplasma sp.]